MRILFLTGKGGVGKTTVAAATAVRLAQRGTKTLLLSADAAHSVGDVLGGITLTGVPVELAPGLAAAHLDPQARFEQSWGALQRQVIDFVQRGGGDPIAAAELTVLPGVEEVLALLAVRDHVREDRWDAIVVDCGPTAETMRLLAVPDTLGWYLDRLLPMQRRLARGARPIAALLGAGAAVPPDALFEAAAVLAEDLTSVRELLRADTARVAMVLTPESMVVAEARRARTALALYGYALDAVIANRVIGAGGGVWAAQRRAAQRTQMAVVADSFAGLAVHQIGFRPTEPVGLDALAEVGAELFGALPGRDPLAVAAPDSLLSVRADGADFELQIGLPLADAAHVHAARSGDDLVLTVDGRRRLVALPSVLRRCTVTGATFATGTLTVRFVRDPNQWPAVEEAP